MIPRKNSTEVKEIIAREDLNNNEKAILIHKYDYNMLCRENPGYLPKQVSEGEIKRELDYLEIPKSQKL